MPLMVLSVRDKKEKKLMSGMQNVSFGALTAKIGQIKFENIDLNKDGIITQEEIEALLGKEQFDILDLSTIDKDADTKVTKEEYELWEQEKVMLEYMDTMKTQAARDLVGQDAEDIKAFVEKLTDYEKTYIEKYSKEHKDLSGMAQEFIKELPKKYNELKKDALMNNKTVLTTRVIKNVIENFMELDKQNGGTFLNLIDKKASSLSENAKRLLSKELSREAEKFIKKYEGNNLEADLTVYLKDYLEQSDKEKLADAIGIWEKGKQELEELPEEVRFLKIKAKAKNLLLTALENDISIKVGDIFVRSESAIPAALGQFKDTESLIWAFDKAISELSSKTRAQEIKEKDEAKKQAAMEEAYEELKKQEEESTNIFNL